MGWVLDWISTQSISRHWWGLWPAGDLSQAVLVTWSLLAHESLANPQAWREGSSASCISPPGGRSVLVLPAAFQGDKRLLSGAQWSPEAGLEGLCRLLNIKCLFK
jgi:hypothetical protein